MTLRLDWLVSVRVSREVRDMIADYAMANDKAKGRLGTMVRIMVEKYLEEVDTVTDTAKARANRMRFLRRRRLEEIEALRRDYSDLLQHPNPEEERIVQERAVELGMEWPPKSYSEAELSTIMLRLRRLWGTEGRSGAVTFRVLCNSLRRRYDNDQLFVCLSELQHRNRLKLIGDRPIQILEALEALP